jgi:hypothetical protein
MTNVITPGAGAAASAPGGSVDGVRRSELPGGLRVLTEAVPGVRSVSIGIWISTGCVPMLRDPQTYMLPVVPVPE